MADSKDIKEFPDLSNKLAAPTKKSIFERQKAEAEAKRIREEAETAAVYEDFVKSFDDEPVAPVVARGLGNSRPGNAFDGRAPSGPAKRHFTSATRNSGPGSLGQAPNFSKKISLDGGRVDRERERGIFAFDDPTGPLDAASAFKTSDDENEKTQDSKSAERAMPKPTLQLSSLPPGTSPAVIESLVPSSLTVDAVRIIAPPGPDSSLTGRKSMSAIVTFAKDTPASDLDTAVSSLQNRYLGWGFYLSLSRHLSSAALGSMNTASASLHSVGTSLPFGAQPIPIGPGASLSRAPPPGMHHRGGFAPPSSYGPPDQRSFGRSGPPVIVKIEPPSDIRQLRLIHKTLESMLTHGPEFEALLMSRPEVQRDEKWAWLWDTRSPGGVWYRWRLWQILTAADAKGARVGPAHRLFDGAAPWIEPEDRLTFEFITQFTDLVSDSEYNSSDEDDSGDEGAPRKRRRQFHDAGGPPPERSLGDASDGQTYLNPLHKAKLTHLLARLPTTTGRLRRGDVARVTAFAITHAGQGADEVVDMLISNVIHPFSWSQSANLGPKEDNIDGELDNDEAADKKDSKDDVSGATQIALHLISDILSASSTSGVRHAWRYRSLFEISLTTRKIFADLGRMEKALGWGRLRAEKWRRSIGSVLQLWEGWCVFPAVTQERLVEEFNNPPLTKEEAAAEADKKAERAGIKGPAKSKWKSVAANATAETNPFLEGAGPNVDGQAMGIYTVATGVDDMDGELMEDVDGAPMEDVDGAPMENVDGAPMEDLDGAPMEDVDGEPMDEDLDGQAVPDELLEVDSRSQDPPLPMVAASVTPVKRQRPKAVDMFADSDED